MQKEAQVGIETIVGISAIIILFLASISFTFFKGSEIITTNAVYERKSECNKIANTISQSSLIQGSSTNITTKAMISIYNTSNLIAIQDYKEIAYCSFEKVKIANYTNITGHLIFNNVNGVIVIS